MYIADAVWDEALSGHTTSGSTGKTLYVAHLVIRDTTASLAGGTDYDFTNWIQSAVLSSMTTANTTYAVISSGVSVYTETGAGVDFQITPSTGSTADADATIDVFGYLV